MHKMAPTRSKRVERMSETGNANEGAQLVEEEGIFYVISPTFGLQVRLGDYATAWQNAELPSWVLDWAINLEETMGV